MNWVTASAGAVTIPLTSIPGSPPLELDDEELELELEEALLLDELELAELDELDDELEEELLLDDELETITPLDELDDELELDELDELELELEEELLATAPLELDDELDELEELDEELELELPPGLSRCFESELLQPNSRVVIDKAKKSL